MSTEMSLSPHQKCGVDENIYSALKNSLYPGATDESVMMVVSYCNAAKLDPMTKPVHIVPMYITDKSKPKNEKGYYPSETRDIIMPGIGLYRIQAERTGEYAGITEPEFGEEITKSVGNREITFPKWCKIKVIRRSKKGYISEFPAKEFWIENYAQKSRDDDTPNATWTKRPYGQLAKCAEAQALRKAFPELGSHPTAEEMEGKQLDNANIIDDEPQKINAAENIQKKIKSNIEKNTQNKSIELKNEMEETNEIILKINSCTSKEDLHNIFMEINKIKSYEKKKNLIEIYKTKMNKLSNLREKPRHS